MRNADTTSPTDREQALCLLESYLETTQDDQVALFIMPRNPRVDELLCRWAFDRQEVSGRLLGALQEVPLIATPAELEQLASGSAAEAARRVHPLVGLQGRLNGYLHGLQGARRREVDPEGDTVSLDENEVPIYICIPAGTRDRRDSTSPRRLGAMVRSWEQFKRGTAFKLDAVGPLLSNTRSTTSRTPGPKPERPPGGSADRSYFERRLAEELGRGRRQGASVSIVLIQVLPSGDPAALDQETLERVEELVAGSLRVYDIICQQGGLELMLILPGADSVACASVVARIREQLCSEPAPLPLQLSIGTASFPDEGDQSLELMAQAGRARQRDQRRLLQGEVEIDSIPASMVEGLARRDDEQPTTIWLGGVPIRMPVRVLQSDQGLRLKLPLAFLRKGTAFRLDLEQGKHCSGVLRTAELGRYRSTDDAPVVYLEITTAI
jgi:diguanylate cyclase (GGDEF)-like protein